MTDPAVEAIVQAMVGGELTWAQVVIRRGEPQDGTRFTLRHVSDRDRGDVELEVVRLQDLRAIAQFTEARAFRPLKAAPNLKAGWLCDVSSISELGQALRILYPGSVADWHAMRVGTAQPISYRDYVGRQSGMYRVTQKLTDAAAAQVTRACCAPGFCLKRRLWSVEGIEADPAIGKSDLVCLEPCALLIELARKSARMDQETAVAVHLSPSELEITLEALGASAGARRPELREADFSAAANPRMAALIRERLSARKEGT